MNRAARCLHPARRAHAPSFGGRVAACAAVGALAACTSILGDDFEVTPEPATTGSGSPTGGGGASTGLGGAAPGGSGGAAAAGGAPQGGGGSGATSGGGQGPTGGGGQGPTGGGGSGPGDCTLGTDVGCDPGDKCSIVDAMTGALGCVDAGSYLAWTACDIDTECAVGLWCDPADRVCRPICPPADCPPDGGCVAAPQNDEGGTIPGLGVCVANCEPDGSTPCNPIHGPVSCARQEVGWSCVASGGGEMADWCIDDADCSPGLLCNESHCWEWCLIGDNGTCTEGAGSYCMPVEPPALHGADEYGTCVIG